MVGVRNTTHGTDHLGTCLEEAVVTEIEEIYASWKSMGDIETLRQEQMARMAHGLRSWSKTKRMY